MILINKLYNSLHKFEHNSIKETVYKIYIKYFILIFKVASIFAEKYMVTAHFISEIE